MIDLNAKIFSSTSVEVSIGEVKLLFSFGRLLVGINTYTKVAFISKERKKKDTQVINNFLRFWEIKKEKQIDVEEYDLNLLIQNALIFQKD